MVWPIRNQIVIDKIHHIIHCIKTRLQRELRANSIEGGLIDRMNMHMLQIADDR